MTQQYKVHGYKFCYLYSSIDHHRLKMSKKYGYLNTFGMLPDSVLMDGDQALEYQNHPKIIKITPKFILESDKLWLNDNLAFGITNLYKTQLFHPPGQTSFFFWSTVKQVKIKFSTDFFFFVNYQKEKLIKSKAQHN